MYEISQSTLDGFFEQKRVLRTRVVRTASGSWYFTVDVAGQDEKKIDRYVLHTTRGNRRFWSDPRPLFQFLKTKYGVLSGSFELVEDNHEDSTTE